MFCWIFYATNGLAVPQLLAVLGLLRGPVLAPVVGQKPVFVQQPIGENDHHRRERP